MCATFFVGVSGRLRLKNLTQNRRTLLDLVMAYLVEIDTAAGPLIFGNFATLNDAKKYAAGFGVIRPLFPPTIPAADLIELTLKKPKKDLTHDPQPH